MPALKIATYNIHQWVGGDGRVDVLRVLSVIRSLNADLVALQEVLLPKDGFTLRDLESETGMQLIPGRTLYREDAEYGNVLLAKVPVLRTFSLDLTVPPFEPRGAILAAVLAGSVQVSIVATHLGMRQAERQKQMATLLSEIDKLEGIAVLAGDLNEWNPLSPVIGKVKSVFGKQRSPCTFPARLPVLALDRILVRPPMFERAPCVVRSGTAGRASDHLPLEAVIGI